MSSVVVSSWHGGQRPWISAQGSRKNNAQIHVNTLIWKPLYVLWNFCQWKIYQLRS